MPNLPLRPNLRDYRGQKEILRRRNDEYNRIAQRVADHVNRLVADDPDEIQQYFFGSIAIDLGLDVDDVRSAISNGGYNGITLRVTEDDRRAMAGYKSKP